MPVTACRCMHNWNYMPLHACLPRPAAACIIATACRRMHDCHCLPPHTCLPLLAAACMLATACRCMHYCHSLPLHAFRPLQILGMHDVQVIEHLHGVCCRAGECLPLPSCMLPHAWLPLLAVACTLSTCRVPREPFHLDRRLTPPWAPGPAPFLLLFWLLGCLLLACLALLLF
jgi:hypothetical protein